jgi:xanthine dehydrogenase/oxidase
VFKKAPLKSHQLYEIRPFSSNIAPVGRPIVHKSAENQSTGEAQYVDDMPRFENEAYMGLVLSTRAHAEIVSIDAYKALEMDGVYGFMSSEDMPDERNNYVTAVAKDEEVFARGKVNVRSREKSTNFSGKIASFCETQKIILKFLK